jgi:hypothetical protein
MLAVWDRYGRLDRQALGAVGRGDRCPYPRSFPNSISRSTARKLQADRQISFELDQLDSDEAEEFYFAYGVRRQLDVL